MKRHLRPEFRPRAIRQFFRDTHTLIARHAESQQTESTQELARESYLALFASFEGTLRREFDYQVQYGKGAIGDRCRAERRRRKSDWLKLDEILDCWRADADSGAGIQLITNHQVIRDWLAHGRAGTLPDNGKTLLDPLRLFADLEKAASLLRLPSLG